ncbi:MAG TPA: VOC family protein [Phototrophicaceae bacterium]|nr:VOC family protein [Phototrophicaceae bacterium]
MKLDRLDHLVLTVANIERTCAFYERVLGIEVITFGQGRKALRFGDQKINLHNVGKEIEPKAGAPTPGSGDLCFTTSIPLDEVIAYIQSCGVEIIVGPVERSGATTKLLSVYFRDPDGNLIEVSNQIA